RIARKRRGLRCATRRGRHRPPSVEGRSEHVYLLEREDPDLPLPLPWYRLHQQALEPAQRGLPDAEPLGDLAGCKEASLPNLLNLHGHAVAVLLRVMGMHVAGDALEAMMPAHDDGGPASTCAHALGSVLLLHPLGHGNPGRVVREHDGALQQNPWVRGHGYRQDDAGSPPADDHASDDARRG